MNRRAFLQRTATLSSAAAPSPQTAARAPLPITAGLTAYTAPLSEREALHLLRRCGYGSTVALIQTKVGLAANEAVDALVDEALAQSLPEPPVWKDEPIPGRNASNAERDAYNMANREWYRELQLGWHAGLPGGGLRERMTVFWSNHFVTEYRTYQTATLAYRYLNLLRTHALGSFRTLLREIGLTPAMLVYLNGQQNQVTAPNENYARELLELFTMRPQDAEGNDNYTQQDITEIARALTGWVADGTTLESRFLRFRHDGDAKTIFGLTRPYDYDGVINIIFQERGQQTAYAICEQLYQAFVYDVPAPDIVAELADLFVANDYDIASVVRVLLKSEHFFDAAVHGAKIKSPIDMLGMLINETMTNPPEQLYQQYQRFAGFAGQTLFSPPNVAGWPGHHAWLDTSTLPLRWLTADALLQNGRRVDFITLVQTAEHLHDPLDKNAAFTLPVRLAEYMMAVPLENVSIPTIAEPFGGDLVNRPVPDEVLNGPAYAIDLAKIFLGGLPWYEWFLYGTGAHSVIANYVRFLLQLPEYQLT